MMGAKAPSEAKSLAAQQPGAQAQQGSWQPPVQQSPQGNWQGQAGGQMPQAQQGGQIPVSLPTGTGAPWTGGNNVTQTGNPPVQQSGPQSQQSGNSGAVPTTANAQQYTFDQLAVATANLASSGRDVFSILGRFGVNMLMDLPREKYGEYATALRVVLTDGDDEYTKTTAVGAALPESSITLSAEPITLEKYGRLINAPYEAVRQQRLDVFAAALRAVGAKLAKAIEGAAVKALTENGSSVTGGGTFNYAALAAFWGKFDSCDMNVILCSPATAAKILAFDEMNKTVTTGGGNIVTPFGAEIVVSPAVDDKKVIGLDKTCALEMIRGGEVSVDVDKLISKLSDGAAVAVNAGFSVISADAVKVLTIA